MDERFYVAKSSGYPNPALRSYESEFSVIDSMEAHKIVASFFAYRVRGTNMEQWNTLEASARRRAQLYCLALNRAERGEHFNWNDLRLHPKQNERGPDIDRYEIVVTR